MRLFSTKSRYSIGMTKEPVEPVDLMAIYEKVRKRKKEENDKAN